MANIYLLPIENVRDYDTDYFKSDFPERLEKAETYADEADKLRCLGVAVLLKKILGLKENDIKYGEYGKPYSDNTDKHFSISHSGNFTVLAVSDTSIGVDIQHTGRKLGNSIYRVLSKEENEYLKNKNTKEFFKFWSLKESFSKALGLGIHISFSETSVMPFIKSEPIIYKENCYYGNFVEMNDYYLSVCSKNRQTKINITNIK